MGIRASFLIIITACVVSSYAFSQGAVQTEPEKKPKPPQIGLTDETKIESRGKECPDFVWQFPKPKKAKDAKNLTDRWAVVDMAKRKEHELQQIEQELEEAKKEPEKNKARLEELESRRMHVSKVFKTRFLLLEVKDNAEQYLFLDADRVTRDNKLKDILRKPALADMTTILDKDITTKDEQKKGRGHHVLEVTGTDSNGAKVWVRYHTWLVPVQTGNPFRVNMMQVMPESLRVAENIKEQQQLETCLRM